MPFEGPPARSLRRAQAHGEVPERKPGLDGGDDGLDVPTRRALRGELAQQRQDLEVAQVLSVAAEQGGEAAARIAQPPGRVRLPEPVARSLLEVLEQQANGLALLLHDRPVQQALVREPAHPARREEHERRVDREQHRDVLADRGLAAVQADEQPNDHGRGEQDRDAEDRADDVGVRDEPGADRHHDDPVGVVHARQEHCGHAGPGQTEGEREELRDQEAPPDRALRRGRTEGAAVMPRRGQGGGAEQGHRGGQAAHVAVRGDLPEHVGEHQRDRGLGDGRVFGELQSLAQHRDARLVAQPDVLGTGRAEPHGRDGISDPAVPAGIGCLGERVGGAHDVRSVRRAGPSRSRRVRGDARVGWEASGGLFSGREGEEGLDVEDDEQPPVEAVHAEGEAAPARVEVRRRGLKGCLAADAARRRPRRRRDRRSRRPVPGQPPCRSRPRPARRARAGAAGTGR